METLDAVVITADDTVTRTRVGRDLAAYQDIVDGYIELIPGTANGTVYVNEEAALLGLPMNRAAAQLL